jgi:hypothetical protein
MLLLLSLWPEGGSGGYERREEGKERKKGGVCVKNEMGSKKKLSFITSNIYLFT